MKLFGFETGTLSSFGSTMAMSVLLALFLTRLGIRRAGLLACTMLDNITARGLELGRMMKIALLLVNSESRVLQNPLRVILKGLLRRPLVNITE